MSKVTINGIDIKLTYGIVIQSGLDDFLKPPSPKPRYTHDWLDQNGVEVDFTSPAVYQAKDVALVITLFASSEDDFWTKHKGFFTLLSSGRLRLYSEELSRSFYVYHSGTTSLTRLTRIKDVDMVCENWSITLNEPVPSFWNPFSYLVDKNGNKLITKTNNKIIIT